MFTTNLEKAIIFSSKAHRGQMRKGTKIPYITHPFSVSMILQSQDCEEHVIIAGLLHDTVEDTAVTLEEIDYHFGSKVMSIVKACTEPKKSTSWERRKEYLIESIKYAPKDAKYVACADKLHNLSTLVKSYFEVGDVVWKRFSRGYDLQKWYLRSMLDSLFFGLGENELKPMFFDLKREFGEFFQ